MSVPWLQWLSPNVLTLLGFVCTLLCMCIVAIWMPHLEEAAPRWVYLVMCVLLFIYQVRENTNRARRGTPHFLHTA